MSGDQPATDEHEARTFGTRVTGIMIAFLSIGVLLTLPSLDDITGPDFGWLWISARIGFAVSLLYLLTKIANGVHRPDADD